MKLNERHRKYLCCFTSLTAPTLATMGFRLVSVIACLVVGSALSETCESHAECCEEKPFCYDGECRTCEQAHTCEDGIDGTVGCCDPEIYPTDDPASCPGTDSCPGSGSACEFDEDDDDCADSETWYSKKAKKDCSWVENKPDKRCKVKTKNGDGVDAFAGCPEACGVCELECGEDSDVWYFKKAKKDCGWAGKNTKRCKKTDKDNYGKVKVPASVACPEACGTTTSCDGGDVLACGTYELDEAADAWVDGDTTTYGDIADWDVSCVTSMDYMFKRTDAFNGDLSDWDLGSVWTMQMMFHEATAFNGPLDWCVLDNVILTGAFAGTKCADGVDAAEDEYYYYYHWDFDENTAEAVAMAAECGVDVQADC